MREIAAIYLAAGLDPSRAVIFRQSSVGEHAELSWLLNCIAKVGELSRMTQFKDKTQRAGPRPQSVGLYAYPVLQAADILLYNAHLVPVGEDQRQHLELARTLARRFNHLYGETFVVPEIMIPKTGARIMALDEPTAKMSKSRPTPGGYISLLDEPDDIRRKIRRARTDSGTEVSLAPPISRPSPTSSESTQGCRTVPFKRSRNIMRAKATGFSRISPRWSWKASPPSGSELWSCWTTRKSWTPFWNPAPRRPEPSPVPSSVTPHPGWD